MRPRVSICVPNLNTRPFLPERFATIRDQSFQDWELLVYDSYSTDGAWEYITNLAARDSRMRAWQGPREGTPGSWNPCIREARGDYVYIATSDDTMAPDCLEKLVAALDAHPDCDLAHCALKTIDADGRDITRYADWWTRDSAFALSSKALLRQPHVRLAPFDGLLHLLGASVYISITQLLIRRTLFDRIGGFDATWGSVGDFNWDMRAGLVANTVHVPDTWGGWRLHGSQATGAVRFDSHEHAHRLEGMIADAIARCEPMLAAPLAHRLLHEWAPQARELRAFTKAIASRTTAPVWERAGFLMRQVCAGSTPAREYLYSRLPGRCAMDWVSRTLKQVSPEPFLVPVGDRKPVVAA